jgi:hypothetical protein
VSTLLLRAIFDAAIQDVELLFCNLSVSLVEGRLHVKEKEPK